MSSLPDSALNYAPGILPIISHIQHDFIHYEHPTIQECYTVKPRDVKYFVQRSSQIK